MPTNFAHTLITDGSTGKEVDETYHNKDAKSLYGGEGCDELWSDYFFDTGLDRWCHRKGDDEMLKLEDA